MSKTRRKLPPKKTASPEKKTPPQRAASSIRVKLAAIGVIGTVALAAVKVTPNLLTARHERSKTPTAEKSETRPSTSQNVTLKGASGNAINNDVGNVNVSNTGSPGSVIQTGPGTINVTTPPPPAAPPKEAYNLKARVDYVSFETVTKEDVKRGETVRTGGWGDSKPGSLTYDLPEGAFDVEYKAWWNIDNRPHSSSVRREGNKIVAEGTIRSPLDGTRVWGELHIGVKYNLKVPKAELASEELSSAQMPADLAEWTFDKGPIARAAIQVFSDAGKPLDSLELTRTAQSDSSATATSKGRVKVEVAKNSVRVIRL